MAYNTRRSGEAVNNVGMRRNPPIGNSFVSGGQLPPQQRPAAPAQRPAAQNQPQRPLQQPTPKPQQQGPRPTVQQTPKPQQQQPKLQPQPTPKPQQQITKPQQLQQTPKPQQQLQQTPKPQQQQQIPKPQQQPIQKPQQQQQPIPKQQQPIPKPQPQQPILKPQPSTVQSQLLEVPKPEAQPPAQLMEESVSTPEVPPTPEGTEKKKPFWQTRSAGKVNKKEKQRRRNFRLSKILIPKNAVMILNELIKGVTYQVSEVPEMETDQYVATALVEGMEHIGYGRAKSDAKSQAAEAALKYIVRNRKFATPAIKAEPMQQEEDVDGDVKMDCEETTEEGGMPWQHVASFALYKLLNSWGEDITASRPGTLQAVIAPAPAGQKPAKKMPENAAAMNPLMLMNQMLPFAQFEEIGKEGIPPNVTFTMQCNIEGQLFQGTGTSKKAAKKMAAYEVCCNILNVQYPPEAYV